MDNYNQHYIAVRLDGAIIDTWSNGTHPDKDTTNAICINEQGGFQFRLFHNGEENPNIRDMNGIPLYKWNGKKVIPRTDDEIAEERTTLLNSPERRAAEIKRRLTELDNQTTRPLRAILAGTSTDEDKDKLRDIETQVIVLRDQLSKLSESIGE